MKPIINKALLTNGERIWNACLYVRLSREDGDKEESDSIANQKALIRDYASTLPDINIAVEMADDGFSGTNFKRPSFIKMMEEIEAGRIDCVIVKDLSRLGRNFIETGKYLEQIFPFLGVRFISVTDRLDSQYMGTASMDTAFKNLIYDLYSKDLSQKITGVRRTKAAQGKFITCYAPYGFKKSEDQRLLMDEESGKVVQRIFQMALHGVSRAEITRILNKEGIPSPLMLRKQRKENFPNYHVNEQCHWTLSVICKILQDRRYTGDAVYGKSVPAAVGSRKDIQVSKEEWIIVPGMHESIISWEDFNKVQTIFTKHNYSRKKESSPFAGKIKCAVCNHTMSNQKKNTVKKGMQSIFRCKTSLSEPEYACFHGSLAEEDLEMSVVNHLNCYADLAWDIRRQTAEERWKKEKEMLREDTARLKKELQAKKNAGLTEYEALKEGRISKGSFLKKRAVMEQQMEGMKEKIQNNERFIIEPNLLLMQCNPFVKLTKAMLDSFVEEIMVDNSGAIHIKWKFSMEFLDLQGI